MTSTPQEARTLRSYDENAETWVSEHQSNGYWRDEMARFHELLPYGRILEIGAGGGRDAQELIDLGYDYTGTDASTGFLTVLNKKIPGVVAFERSVYDLPPPGTEPFDGFWASAVLLHIPKARIDEALAGIRRSVKEGAIGFISLKNGVGEKVEQEVLGGKPFDRFFAYWTKDEFIKVLSDNGFSVVDYFYHVRSESTKWHSFIVKSER